MNRAHQYERERICLVVEHRIRKCKNWVFWSRGRPERKMIAIDQSVSEGAHRTGVRVDHCRHITPSCLTRPRPFFISAIERNKLQEVGSMPLLTATGGNLLAPQQPGPIFAPSRGTTGKPEPLSIPTKKEKTDSLGGRKETQKGWRGSLLWGRKRGEKGEMQERQDSFYLRRTRPDKRKEASRKTIPPDGTIRELTGTASVKVNERGGRRMGFGHWEIPCDRESWARQRERKKNLGGFSGSQRKD